ncbi:adenine phosphoribosyltransferase [Knoellia subterranea]|uniref:Adenine phosphoribosyltransferase n=1 Tax=Knoellia subterranea KCTC 19937 TaxID=1385521 RepID=A0A0A0JRE6_9MICO|nr:adenine phosphoribosyltransferase [Knoellia subterranea]KGN38612.1 adenine phosphoribosyltransferase [Knoellia subterranea KCTC 19937]
MAEPDISDLVANRLRDVADFPKQGVVFKDITPLLGDGDVFGAVIRELASRHTGSSSAQPIDAVAGVEARGFIIGAALAHELGVGFVPVRKVGKLPGDTVQRTYDLEYGTATIEIQSDAVSPGQRVLLVDDVLATGGTAIAAWDLLGGVGAEVVEFATIVELAFLGGRKAMGERPVRALHVVGDGEDA